MGEPEPTWEVTTQIVEAPQAVEAELENGNLKVIVFVQHSGEIVARIFHVGTVGQKKILDALTGGLMITDKMPPDAKP